MPLKPILSVAMFATLAAAALPALAQNTPSLAYPTTRTVDHVDTYHDTRVPEPCRWLEDDNAADTKAWVQAQNAVTEQAFAAMPQRQPVRQQCSACRRWSPEGVLTLTATKRPLIPATGAARNGCCWRCSCRRPHARRFAVPATASAPLELAVPTHRCRTSLSRADVREVH